MTDTAATPTPSQTVGPYFNIGLPGDQADLVDPGADEAVRLWGIVTDGEGVAVPDALIEIWQAGPDGHYDHPEDAPGSGFPGFGRAETGDDGRYEFVWKTPASYVGTCRSVWLEFTPEYATAPLAWVEFKP